MEKERAQQIKTISIAAHSTEYTIDFDTLKQYDRVVEILVYGDTSYSANRNMQFVGPLKIDNKEIFCDGFDTFLLSNRLENRDKRTINAKAAGSRVEGKIKDPSSSGFVPYTATIMLILERDVKK